jgi:hypothetical protein
MSYASINGATIVKGQVSIPAWGIWHADLWLDHAFVVGSPATLVIADLSATCTVVRSVDWTGQRGVRVVGGYGGWRQVVAPQQYDNPAGITVSTVVGDTATAVGERVVIATDAQLGVQWIRARGAASEVLDEIAPDAWWMGLDGVTHLGPRDLSAITGVFTATWVDQPANVVRIATENPAEWLPGKTYAGPQVQGTIDRVQHWIDAGKFRTEVVNV